MIQQAEHVYLAAGVSGAERCPFQFWLHDAEGRRIPGRELPQHHAVGISYPAFVNHSRWLVQCEICNSAQLAAKDDPRFFCIECQNGGQGWIAVVWPDDAEAIEAALVLRPIPHTRGWDPGETVEDLLAQNAEHGVG